MSFIQKLQAIIQKNNSLLCVGLDPDMDKLPKHLLNVESPIFEFNKAIIDATHDVVCAYKPNIAFYSADGLKGLDSLQQTIDYIQKQYPDVPVILDAKRGDVGSTALYYAIEAFDIYKTDAVTVNPYLGFDSLEPFLKRKEKGIIVICRTSNKGATDFQDTKVSIQNHLGGVLDRTLREKNEPLYLFVAKKVIEWNKINNNCLMVIGATWPEELKKIREIAPSMFFLIPGLGTQGGDLEKTMKYGLTKDKSGLILNISRAILYASDENNFAEKAREKALEFKNEINQYRKQ